MSTPAAFAEIASLAGDLARAGMLHALMDGRALTAAELARAAGVTPQTASGHLGRMVAAGLLAIEKQGRHRYHRLASPAVARMMESIMQVAAEGHPPEHGPGTASRRVVTGPRNAALREARTCYDHLAGRLGVALADALVRDGHVELAEDAGMLTESGSALLARLGVELGSRRSAGRLLCRPCLDWSERRPHLAGTLGAALCAHAFERHWIRRIEGTRAVTVTPVGERQFREALGMR